MSPTHAHSNPAALRAIVLTGVALATFTGPARSDSVTERVSVSETGAQGNSSSLHHMSISGDARFVAFQSDATNLVGGDTNLERDIFVRDRVLGTTTRVSVSSSGIQSNGSSYRPSISSDGRFVAFESYATNLVPGDTNGMLDVFLHDRLTGATTRRSVDSAGAQANSKSFSPSLSGDGRWLAFASTATNLAPVHPPGITNIFLHDRVTGATTLVSHSASGGFADNSSLDPSLSADGRSIAFSSRASNLLPSPTNGFSKIYVRDRISGAITLASPALSGAEVNGDCIYAMISATGRSIAFQSFASNLVSGDTNGQADLFVRDFALGVTDRVSVSTAEVESNGSCSASEQPPGISADGRFVVFSCYATNLVANSSGFNSIYLRDRVLGTTLDLAVGPSGAAANSTSLQPAMTADGRFVAFASVASNLIVGDTNGDYDIFLRGPTASPWSDLGEGLAGTSGTPLLIGSGPLAPTSAGGLDLFAARANTIAICFVALAGNPAPIACGTLVPLPYIAAPSLTTDAFGAISIPWASWPSGFSGTSIYFQFLVPDPAASCGVAFSNALRADPP